MGTGRLLAVHAHPDDETLATGGTLARYAAAGVGVTLVTCTLGEAGEVIPDELRHLTGVRLGRWRRTELARAARELGVTDHRLLGGGRWVDSGMVWLRPGIAGASPDSGPDAFALASVDEAARSLAAIVREVRPHVVLTYDPEGGYGHPDHVQAHRVTMRAVELAADPDAAGETGAEAGWSVPRVGWARVTRSWAEAERARSATQVPTSMVARDAHAPFPPAVVDDGRVDVALDVRAVMDRTAAALRAHATQVRVEGDWFALSDGVAQLRRPTEWYEIAHRGVDRAAPRGSAVGPCPVEDLFHGLSLTD